MTGSGNFSFPLSGFLYKLADSVHGIQAGVSNREWVILPYLIFELICPVSLLVQSVYLLFNWNLSCNAWKAGIGFVALFCFLGPSVWAGQYAYARMMLPLTVSFNLMIARQKQSPAFWIWFGAGNAGMAEMCLETLYRFFILP